MPETYAEQVMREDREKKEAQAAVDRAAPAVRAAIAELEAPWELHRSGLEMIRPPEGDPFTPYVYALSGLTAMSARSMPTQRPEVKAKRSAWPRLSARQS